MCNYAYFYDSSYLQMSVYLPVFLCILIMSMKVT